LNILGVSQIIIKLFWGMQTAYTIDGTVRLIGNWNFRSHVLSLPGAKVRGKESSIIPVDQFAQQRAQSEHC